MREHDVAARVSSDIYQGLSAEPHDIPFVQRYRRREYKENSCGYRLDAVVDTDEVTFAEHPGFDLGIVIDQAVRTGFAAEDLPVFDDPHPVIETEPSVIRRDDRRIQDDVISGRTAEGNDILPEIIQSICHWRRKPVKYGNQEIAPGTSHACSSLRLIHFAPLC